MFEVVERELHSEDSVRLREVEKSQVDLPAEKKPQEAVGTTPALLQLRSS